MRVLLIDADQVETATIKAALETYDIYAYATDLGEDGVALAHMHDYDIIVTELNVPDMFGHRIIRALRTSKIETPILVLSRMSDVEDKVLSISLGADDYLTKPFDMKELVARIHAIVRRSRGYSKSTLEIGDLVVNIDQKTVELCGRPVSLSITEYKILELLSLRKGIVLTEGSILYHLYFGGKEPDSNVIPRFIANIRKKMRTREYVHTAAEGRGWFVAYDRH